MRQKYLEINIKFSKNENDDSLIFNFCKSTYDIEQNYKKFTNNFYCSCLAALGLVENSATNVVAAMLVSPLMVNIYFVYIKLSNIQLKFVI